MHASLDGDETVKRGDPSGPPYRAGNYRGRLRPWNANLRYDEAGEGRPVVLVHGNFAGRSWWRELLANPPPGVRLIAPDLPGFGESAVGPIFSPSIHLYAAAVHGFPETHGVEAPVLVGHSSGAAVVVQLAIDHPGRPAAAMLLSPPPLGGLGTPGFVYPWLESYRYDRRGLRSALRRVMRTRVPPYLDELVTEAQRMHPLNFSANARILGEWDVRRAAHLYASPVVVASGYRDALIPPPPPKPPPAPFRMVSTRTSARWATLPR